MKTNEIIAALRCSYGVPGLQMDCRICPYHMEETVDGVDCAGCECYRIVVDAVDRLEELVERCARYAEEIAVLRGRQRWIPVEEQMPEADEFVLAIVSGQPTKNIRLENAAEIASYWREDGWVLEAFPEWEDPQVSHWMPLSEAPEAE